MAQHIYYRFILLVTLLTMVMHARTLHSEPKLGSRKDFFEQIIGVKESDFQTSDRALFIEWDDNQQSFFIKNQKTNERFRAGTFSTLSIKQLRMLTHRIQAENPGTFNVIEALNPIGTSYAHVVDIGANQADPTQRDTVFQVASNFNGLELLNANDIMANITNYIHDYTQGPFASISAAAGLLLRHYYIFFDFSYCNPLSWQQHPIINKVWNTNDGRTQCNFLCDTDIPVTNSYVNFSARHPTNINHAKIEDIHIGWHEGIQVSSGFKPTNKQHTIIDDPHQKINQVFTAAVDFGITNRAFKSNSDAIKIAQTILDAAYEGTLRAAAAHGKKKVVLTLVGGGVFNNDLEWISSALFKMKDFMRTSGLTVTLIIFDGNSPSLASQMPSFRKSMQELTRETDGSYTQYSQSHPSGHQVLAHE